MKSPSNEVGSSVPIAPLETTTAKVFSLFDQLLVAAGNAADDAKSIVDAQSTLTYRELIASTCEFCERLAEVGVQRHARVAVILGNRKEFLVSAFGIWRRGAVLVPLSPQLLQLEVRKCFLDASVHAVVGNLSRRSMVEALRQGGVQIEHAWFYDSRRNKWLYDGKDRIQPAGVNIHSAGSSDATTEPSWPALTQYSTGSTGLPKRITRTHAQIISESLSIARVLQLTPADRIIGIAPFFHCYGLVVSALATLFSTATLYPIDGFLPNAIARTITDNELTGFPGVPFMFRLLGELDGSHKLSSLRFALSAGAPLPSATATRFRSLYGVQIRQLYGSTETGVISTTDPRVDVCDDQSVGFAIPGVSIEIVDATERVVPTDQVGRVRVTSEFAPAAYDDSVPTSESYFVKTGFFPGDLGRLSEDGRLTLAGRLRGFINVNGLKVDPCEVEAVLRELADITDVVVFGVPDARSGKDTGSGEIVWAVLVASNADARRAVRAHCARHLAPFKCPQIFEFRDALPTNQLGKVLRGALMTEIESRNSFPSPDNVRA